MANYQLKYYYTFSSLNHKYKTEIYEDSVNPITAQEIAASSNPFSINGTSISNKLDPVHSTGAEISLLSQSDRQFINLYTANMLQYQVRLYSIVNTTNSLKWTGFLNSETYSESFADLENYEVQLTANDGFNLLSRLTYIDNSNNHYNDIITQWTLLQRIFNKLNLPYNSIRVGLSTSISGFAPATNETILHQQYINSSNLYNEDNEPETMRKVLEAILRPLEAFVIQDNGYLYITDINFLANGGTKTFKEYSATNYNYTQDVSINLDLGELSAIGFSSSKSTISIVPGINKQVVKFSPYYKTSLLKEDLTDLDSQTPVDTITHSVSGRDNYSWTEKLYRTNQTYDYITNSTNSSYYVVAQGLSDLNSSKIERYLKIGRNQSSVIEQVFRTHQLGYLVCSNTNYLKLSGQIYVRTKDGFGNPNEKSTVDVGRVRLQIAVKIGYSLLYADRYAFWHIQTSDNLDDFKTFTKGYQKTYELFNDIGNQQIPISSISDNWTPMSLTVKLTDRQTDTSGNVVYYAPHGFLQIAFYQNIDNVGQPMNCTILDPNLTTDLSMDSRIKDIYIKDLKIEITDSQGNVISSDTDYEYQGTLNAQYQNAGDDINLIQGTNKDNFETALGSLMYSDNGGQSFKFIKNWVREGQASNIENLLLRSVISNYTNSTLQLDCDINYISSCLGVITSKYIPDKKFMITGYVFNIEGDKLKVTLQEISKDLLSI
jgi:hypothetical protein